MIRRPDPAHLEGRDLAFHPADPASAVTLGPDQVARYNAQGFLGGLDVYGPREAEEVRAYIDGLLEAVTAAGGRDSYSVNGYHTVCAGLWDIATDERIVALVTDVLGPHLVCWGTHLFAKLPGDGKEVPFHQDAVYWPFVPTRTTTVWLAIDEAGPTNAPVTFVAGSHLHGPIEHEALAPDASRVLTRRALGMPEHPDRSPNLLRAGQVSLHSDLLLHGSEANTSDRRRAGLTLRYAAADVRTLDGFEEWARSSVQVGRGDPSGFWADRPRPDGDHPELMAATPGGAVDAG